MTDKEMMILLSVVAFGAVLVLLILLRVATAAWAELQRRRIEQAKEDVWIK